MNDSKERSSTSLSKQEILLAHIRTALFLLVSDESPISIHLLVMACEEIVASLAHSRRLILPAVAEKVLGDGDLKRGRRVLRSRYNFFKHARNDADHRIEDYDDQIQRRFNEVMLRIVCQNYILLYGRKERPIELFFLYAAMKDRRLLDPVSAAMVAETESMGADLSEGAVKPLLLQMLRTPSSVEGSQPL